MAGQDQAGTAKQLSVVDAQFSMVPRNLTEAMEFAKLIAQSEICPTQFKGKAGDVLVAVQMGMEVGLKPLQAVQNIAVINGRPTLWGDAVKGLVEASGLLEYCVETWDAKTQTATCRAKRKGRPETVRTFSMEDAKRAGLASKQTYQQHGPRMCQMRARSYALRDDFSDVLKGLAVREEVEDYETVGTTPEGVQIMQPRRRSETVVAQPSAPTQTATATEQAQTSEPVVVIESDAKTEAATVTSVTPEVPPAGDGRAVKLLSASERTGGGKTFYSLEYEGLDGSKDSASTFDRGIFEKAQALCGAMVILTIQDGKKVNPKTGRPYQNATAIEAAGGQG